jgi:ABC-type antimicrobial peptide transport system permease subunit
MEHRLTQTVAPLRFAMAVLVVFAVIGIAIAVMGAYGISSYLTECRAREIGVRLAVGARPFDVALLILRGSLGVSALGGILGIVLGITAWRWVSGLLPSTGSHFFSTLACVALCVVVISCAAAQVPVQRILAADPLRALRSE